MKTFALAFVLLCSHAAFAQSKSYTKLVDHFDDIPEVESFSVSGWIGRAVLNMALPEDDKFRNAMDDVKHIRFITIPRKEFDNQNLTVKGFRNYLLKDNYEVLADIRDGGEQITFYHRNEGNRRDRYFVLVEESDEIVAFELKGYIDPTIFNDQKITIHNN